MPLGLIHMQWVVTSIILISYIITIVGLALVIIMENRNPLKTIPWILVLLLAPGIGLIFYFFFGQDNRKQRIISRRTYKRIITPPLRNRIQQDDCKINENYLPLTHLLNKARRTPVFYGTKMDIYTSGTEKYKALSEALLNAKHHIHLQYYIFCDDETGNYIKSILIKKAKEGVKVRVMYDDVGCWNVKKQFFDEMRQAGIEVFPFLKVVFPVFTSKVNYRNHRKIVVIDGHIGFIGGMNIADRYVKGVPWGVWRDTHFRLEGKGVHALQASFLIDWYVVSKQIINDIAYYPRITDIYGDNIMQLVTSGPVGHWRILLQAYIYIVANAKKYVYIQTPYFLPTEGLNQALQTAALGGINVRIMLPEKSDTRTANMATRSFIDDMIKAGAKIYFYQLGFLHSKLLISDDYISSVGSANMDFRSFEHNFEANIFVYQEEFALRLKKIFMHDALHCEQLVPSVWLKRSVKERLTESFMRLFSPLL